jgi:hypothetical protein
MAAAGFTHFLFSNNSVKIEKINDTMYEFVFNNTDENDLLIRSLYELNLGLVKTEANEDVEKYHLDCGSIQTLEQFRSKKSDLLDYNSVLNCCLMVGDQMNYFLKYGFISPYIDIDNIIVIDDIFFAYLNDNFVDVSEDGYMEIGQLYEKHILMGHELYNLKSLPGRIHVNDWIYSVGLLGVYLLTNSSDLQNKSHEKYGQMIEMIQDTKLYFMLLRCLYKNVNERRYLYI